MPKRQKLISACRLVCLNDARIVARIVSLWLQGLLVATHLPPDDLSDINLFVK